MPLGTGYGVAGARASQRAKRQACAVRHSLMTISVPLAQVFEVRWQAVRSDPHLIEGNYCRSGSENILALTAREQSTIPLPAPHDVVYAQ